MGSTKTKQSVSRMTVEKNASEIAYLVQVRDRREGEAENTVCGVVAEVARQSSDGREILASNLQFRNGDCEGHPSVPAHSH